MLIAIWTLFILSAFYIDARRSEDKYDSKIKAMENEMSLAGFCMCDYGTRNPRICLKDFPLIEDLCKEKKWYKRNAF